MVDVKLAFSASLFNNAIISLIYRRNQMHGSYQLAGHMLHIGPAICLDPVKVEKLHFILGNELKSGPAYYFWALFLKVIGL